MSDLNSEGIVQGLKDGISSFVNAGEESASTDGLHNVVLDMDDIIREYTEKGKEYFKEVEDYIKLISTDNADAKKDNKAFQESIAQMLGESPDEPDDKEAPKESGPKLKNQMALGDIVKYGSDPAAAAAILIHGDLMELFGNKKKDEKSKSSDVGSLFKGVAEGAVSLVILAGALALFAVSAKLFNDVDWGDALKGIGLFALFTLGAVLLAKLVGKEKNSFKDFAIGSILMSVALIAFAGALYITGWIMKNVDMKYALLGLGLFALFTTGAVFLAKYVGSEKNSFIDFAIGAILMSVALAAFAGALWIVSKVGTEYNWPIILGTLVLFLGFVALNVLIAKQMGDSMDDLIKFEIASILMAVALAAFAGAIWIASELGQNANWGAVTLTILYMGLVLAGFIVASNFADATSIIKITLCSMLISVALAVFAGAIAIAGLIDVKAIIKATVMLVILTAFMVGMGVLGYVATYIIPGILLMAAAMVAMSVALVAAFGGIFLITLMINAMEFTPKTFANIGFMTLMIAMLGLTGAAMILALPGLILVAIATAIALPAVLGLSLIALAVKAINLTAKDKKNIKASLSTMEDILVDMAGFKISFKTLIKLGILSLSILPAVGAVVALATIGESAKRLADLDIPQEKISKVLEVLSVLISTLGESADHFKDMSGKAAKAFATSLGAVVDAMKGITEIIVTIKDLEEEEVNAAVSHLKMIIGKLFSAGDEKNPTIIYVLDQMPSISKGAVRASEAMVPITQSLGNVADLIAQVKDFSEDDMNQGIAHTQKLLGFLAQTADVILKISDDATGWFGKDKLSKAKTQIREITDCISCVIANVPTDVTAAENLPRFFNQFKLIDTKGFVDAADAINDGMDDLNDAFPSKGNGLDRLIKSVNSIDVGKINNLNSLSTAFSKLAASGDKLSKVADAVSRMDSSLKNMDNRKSLFEKIGDMASNVLGIEVSDNTTQAPRQASQTISSVDSALVKRVIAILERWNDNGIPLPEEQESVQKVRSAKPANLP